jgi:Tfp pilus assembly protein PilF
MNMKKFLSSVFSLLVLHTSYVGAQEGLSADVLRMQENAHGYLSRGDYPNAIMMFSQAIRLAPSDVSLRRDLSYTYFLSGDAKKAKEIIDPVVNSEAADEQSFQVASAVENVLGNSSRARKIINQGLKKFPNSGLLYNSKGNILSKDKGIRDALEAYNAGIAAEPAYPMNYYNAARLYYEGGNAVWALLYAEIYVNLDPTAQRTIEMKKMMIDAYRKLFSPSKDERLPGFNAGDSRNAQQILGFEQLFRNLMSQHSPVISDGLTTENLIMLRTRFMLSWMNNYAGRHPSTLFSYLDRMLHDGVFDAYNQWLFGAADNSQEFALWTKTNSKEYAALDTWRRQHPLQPAVYDPKPSK